jgi:hypothetical protein
VSSYAYRTARWTTYADPKLRRGRSGRPYRRLCAKVKARNPLVCCRCGGYIDRALHHTDPWAFSLDHYPIPLSVLRETGGDPLDPASAAPAHRRCNLSAGNRMAAAPPRQPSRKVAQRRW